MAGVMDGLLVGLQAFQVVVLLIHDWVPLGSLNDIEAVRRQNKPMRLLIVSLVQTVPFVIGLVASVASFGKGFPGWLVNWLWISYGILFAGELSAWWIPYCFTAEPARVARYQAMFARTHAFVPSRNGIRPNTIHVVLHLATLLTLIALGIRPAG